VRGGEVGGIEWIDGSRVLGGRRKAGVGCVLSQPSHQVSDRSTFRSFSFQVHLVPNAHPQSRNTSTSNDAGLSLSLDASLVSMRLCDCASQTACMVLWRLVDEGLGIIIRLNIAELTSNSLISSLAASPFFILDLQYFSTLAVHAKSGDVHIGHARLQRPLDMQRVWNGRQLRLVHRMSGLWCVSRRRLVGRRRRITS
jgi:hypothetical protein